MDWNKFEDGLRVELNNPPESTTEEKNDSWDRLEPKLFPKKRRRLLWYSLNGILLAVAISLVAFVPWKKNQKTISSAPSINLNADKNSLAENEILETKSSSTNIYNASIQASAESKNPSAAMNEPEASKSLETNDSPGTTKSTSSKVGENLQVSENLAKAKSIEAVRSTNSANSSTQTTLASTNSNRTETIADIAAVGEKAKMASADVTDNMENSKPTAKVVASANAGLPRDILNDETENIHASTVSIEEHDGKSILVKTVSVDTGTLVAKIYRKEIESVPEPIEEIDVQTKLEEVNKEDSKGNKKSLVSNIKENLSSDKEEVKIKKPIQIRMDLSGYSNTKSAGSYYGGIIGLEALQELTAKLSLIAGVRYKYGNLGLNLLDQSTTVDVTSVSPIDGDSSLVTLTETQYFRSLKLSKVQTIEIPIHINYEIMKNLMLQAGVNLDFLMSTSVKSSNDWNTVSVSQNEMKNEDIPSSSQTTGAIDMDETALKSKWGLGMHLGMEYDITPRIYAKLSFDKLLKQYYSNPDAKPLNESLSAGQVRFGVGIRLMK